MKEIKQQDYREVEMGDSIIVHAGTFIIEAGISFGACIIAIALIKEGIYQIAHIPPGVIIDELSAMLEKSANQSVVVYQHNIKGVIDVLATGAGTGTIFTRIKAIKRTFKNRDRNSGGLC